MKLRCVMALLVFVFGVFVVACEPSARTTSPAVPMASAVPSVAGDASDVAPSAEGGADGGLETERTLYVAEHYADCEGEGRRRCLRVRESEDKEWTLFYGRIEGFTYEEGHRYQLKVSARESGGAADAPRGRYRLVELVSKTRVP